MCTSINPGIAIPSVAEISSAPSGNVNASRAPMDSISPSRIRIPASAISAVGVIACLQCNSWIGIRGRYISEPTSHRNGIYARYKIEYVETKMPEDSGESLRHLSFDRSRPIYCAGVVVLAEAVPADFGTLR